MITKYVLKSQHVHISGAPNHGKDHIDLRTILIQNYYTSYPGHNCGIRTYIRYALLRTDLPQTFLYQSSNHLSNAVCLGR